MSAPASASRTTQKQMRKGAGVDWKSLPAAGAQVASSSRYEDGLRNDAGNMRRASADVLGGAMAVHHRSPLHDMESPVPGRFQQGKVESGSGDSTSQSPGRKDEEGDGGVSGGQEGREERADTAKKDRANKRRKVNHACVYCRRSHMTCDQGRPCSRCIKRNIGHLCHDEPRDLKKGREDSEIKHADTDGIQREDDSIAGLDLRMDQLHQHRLATESTGLAQVVRRSSSDAQGFDAVNPQLYGDWAAGQQSQQSQLHDIHSYHPNYMFNTSEVTNEYNLLNDFLSTSLLDDGAFYEGGSAGGGADNTQSLFTDPSLAIIMGPLANPNLPWPNNSISLSNQIAPPPPSHADGSSAMSAPSHPSVALVAAATAAASSTSKKPIDKAQERYYMTAADPAGTDTPEGRMNKLLKAKYEAGLLKPFNYVKGYARLNRYMERTVQPGTRLRVLRQIERFRPRFRERMHRCTDVELVMVEMWFERKLMEYDRVFASMAVPACCWRRTGEIFRGNREMAELIHVPLERLRDGKLAIHEIFVEDSLVSYWEKFGAIAFETSQKAILTSCSLKSPGPSEHPELRCCFSFTIQRDTHAIPSLIIGNFLPIMPARS